MENIKSHSSSLWYRSQCWHAFPHCWPARLLANWQAEVNREHPVRNKINDRSSWPTIRLFALPALQDNKRRSAVQEPISFFLHLYPSVIAVRDCFCLKRKVSVLSGHYLLYRVVYMFKWMFAMGEYLLVFEQTCVVHEWMSIFHFGTKW